MYQIEKNIPMPEKTRGASEKYPWRSMSVGDSFFVPSSEGKEASLRVSAVAAGKRLHRRYSVRCETDGVRVFRLS